MATKKIGKKPLIGNNIVEGFAVAGFASQKAPNAAPQFSFV